MTTTKEKMCGGKIRYKSKQKALNRLKSIKKRGIIVPENAGAYHCPFCNRWHLGHRGEERGRYDTATKYGNSRNDRRSGGGRSLGGHTRLG